MEKNDTLPTIAEYYAGKTVFITGATGFVGSVLIEKLLRSCPDVQNIYILLRSKRNKDIQGRFKELIECQVYDKLRQKFPKFYEKILPINGDLKDDGLGIGKNDVQLLSENVNIVFHCAATTKFDEKLRMALELNVLAVKKIVQLCKDFKKLEAFVHVSTAYSNCDRSNIDEVVYEPPIEPQKLLDAAEWLDDEVLDAITPKILGNKPNTYTFTKQLAEYLLVHDGSYLPIAIVRPSIVGAAWKEPYPGWIDNYNGLSGTNVASGKGLLRTLNADPGAVADGIPVDMCVNAVLAVAWYIGVSKPSSALLYHTTTGGVNPVTWGEVEKEIRNLWDKVPLDSCFRRPNLVFTKHRSVHRFWVVISHLIPAYIADLGLFILQKKPRMIMIYNKIHKAIDALSYFSTKTWNWSNSNTKRLYNQLSPEDKKVFYFDPHDIHWPTYIENYCLGVKKFLLNEDMSNVPKAKAHLHRLRYVTYLFYMLTALAIWKLIKKYSKLPRYLCFFIIKLVMTILKYGQVVFRNKAIHQKH